VRRGGASPVACALELAVHQRAFRVLDQEALGLGDDLEAAPAQALGDAARRRSGHSGTPIGAGVEGRGATSVARLLRKPGPDARAGRGAGIELGAFLLAPVGRHLAAHRRG
jgi:hypothetical protein